MLKFKNLVSGTALLTALVGASADAASVRQWKGADGNWSDNSKWVQERYAPSGNHLEFMLGGVVNVDGAYTNYNLHIEGPVRFIGTGILKSTPVNFVNADISVGGDVMFDTGAKYATILPIAATNVSFVAGERAKISMMNLASGLTNLVIRDQASFTQQGSGGTAIQPGGALNVLGGTYSSVYDVSIAEGARYMQSGGSVTARKLTVAAGGSLVLSGGSLTVDELQSSGALSVKGGTLAADAVTLDNVRLELKDARLALPVREPLTTWTLSDYAVSGNGGIDLKLADGLTPGRYVILKADFGIDFRNLPIALTGSCTGWKVYAVGNYIVLASTFDPSSVTIDNPYTWVGATDSRWSTGANWMPEGTPPVADTNVFVLGWGSPVVSNDVANGHYRQIRNLNGVATATPAVPVVIRGQEIELTSTDNRNNKAAVYSLSPYPVFFDCPVRSTQSGFYPYAACKDGDAGAVFLGGLQAQNLQIQGHVYIGCTATVSRLSFSADTLSGCRGHVYVLSGGDFRVTNQLAVVSHGLSVRRGGKASLAGTKFAWENTLSDNSQFDHTVDGELTVEAPYASFPTDQEFQGSGKVWLPPVAAEQTVLSARMVLDGSLTVYLRGFTTAHGGALHRSLFVTNAVTLGADQDWTYGSDATTAAIRTSSASDRALTIAPGSALTIDTSDPKTSLGHTVTLVEPVTGAGTLRKIGAGTLVLAAVSAETDLVHEGGVLQIKTVQFPASVSFGAGAELAFAGNLAATIGTDWMTVMVASAIDGVENLKGDSHRFRVVANGSGFALQARKKPGLVLLVR